MKQIKTTEVTKKESRLVARRCDICDASMPLHYPRMGEDEVTIEMTNSFGGDGGTSLSYDVCAKCWEVKIVPLMRNPPYEHDW